LLLALSLLVVVITACIRIRALRVEARRYAQLVNHSLDGILLTRPDGRILSANPAACRIFRCSQRELIQGGRGLIIDEPELSRLVSMRHGQRTLHSAIWARRKDGKRIRIEVKSAIFEDNGRECSSMSIRDVTERLRWGYQRRLLEAMHECSSDGIAIMDENWLLVWANPAFEHATGLDVADAVGQLSPFFRQLERNPKKLHAVLSALADNGHWHGELISRRADGELYPLDGSIVELDNTAEDGRQYIAIFRDVSQMRRYEHELEFAYQYDALTQLPNRANFEGRVEEALAHSNPSSDVVALLLVNVDHFAAVNESLGHAAGDTCLRLIGQRIAAALDAPGLVARHAGDSFFVLVSNLDAAPASAFVARRILKAFDRPFQVHEQQVALSASIGISLFAADGRSVAQLMRAAESALAEAKASGRADFRYYETGSETRAREFVSKAAEIREGLKNRQFVAAYQPILECNSERVVKIEALARWNHPTRGLLGPGEFIGVAERAGLIAELTEELLAQTVATVKALDAAGNPGISAAVNLSARQFRDPAMVEQLEGIVRKGQLSPERIIFEITESLMMQDVSSKDRIIKDLKERGFRIYMDDFGTGYSSLNYLRNFAIDGLKIDRSFVARLPEDKTDAVIVRSVVAIARELGLLVVAEGIEREVQVEYLCAQGCDLLQGFLFEKPMGQTELLAYIKGSSPDAAQ